MEPVSRGGSKFKPWNEDKFQKIHTPRRMFFKYILIIILCSKLTVQSMMAWNAGTFRRNIIEKR